MTIEIPEGTPTEEEKARIQAERRKSQELAIQGKDIRGGVKGAPFIPVPPTGRRLRPTSPTSPKPQPST